MLIIITRTLLLLLLTVISIFILSRIIVQGRRLDTYFHPLYNTTILRTYIAAVSVYNNYFGVIQFQMSVWYCMFHGFTRQNLAVRCQSQSLNVSGVECNRRKTCRESCLCNCSSHIATHSFVCILYEGRYHKPLQMQYLDDIFEK